MSAPLLQTDITADVTDLPRRADFVAKVRCKGLELARLVKSCDLGALAPNSVYATPTLRNAKTSAGGGCVTNAASRRRF
jgi:hypothetical protein